MHNRKKAAKKRKKAAEVTPLFYDEGDEEEEENTTITTVKTGLRNILRPKFRNVIIASITEKSINATKLCALASLLFLNKVQEAYESNHYDFFCQNGEKIIKDCFLAAKNINSPDMTSTFKHIINHWSLDLPDTSHFGNAIKDLIKTYVTNVKTNLATHAKKRLRAFLTMKVYERNNMNPLVIRYNDEDINHTISWAIFGKDSIKVNDPERPAKTSRRAMLLRMIVEMCWYSIPHTNVYWFTKINWFQSIVLWISIQRQIDEFNTNEMYREQRMWERAHYRTCKRQQSTGHCKCGATKNCPPKVRNFAVIPIAKFSRTHYTLDNFTFYKLLCGVGLISQIDSTKRRKKRNITFNEFMAHKEWNWNQYFNMRKIKWFVRKKKRFRFRVLTDGVSVSLAYDVDKKDVVPIEIQRRNTTQKYTNGGFVNESGTDPGVNTWNATMLRNIETGKEVCTFVLLFKMLIRNSINNEFIVFFCIIS